MLNLICVNVNDKDLTIKKNMILGTVSLVNKENVSELKNDCDILEDESWISKLNINRGIMNDNQMKILTNLLIKHKSIFNLNKNELQQTNLHTHHIDTGMHKPIKCPIRRYSEEQHRFIDETIDDLLLKKIVTPSNSPWNSPILLVKKVIIQQDFVWTFVL